MCGICGYLNLDKTPVNDANVLKRMCDKIAHRGPDDEGLYIDRYAALGHRRLSIIDLAGGHQPLLDQNKTAAVVFNGEIYNFMDIRDDLEKKEKYHFATRSDTEALLLDYLEKGVDCLHDLNGMFAFAIWDKKNERLFCARDRMGKKPLYYTIMNGTFVFASELKSLIAHPAVRRELDLESLSRYLLLEYVPAPYTIFKNIYKLEPAHYLVLNLKEPVTAPEKIETKQYWDISFSPVEMSFEEYESILIQKLRDATARRLISDVPLGVFLSGGIDSGTITSMMADLMPSRDIKTFAIGFREKTFDESNYARIVATKFNTDHKEEMLEPSRSLEILPRIAATLDEPLGDPSIIPTYLLSQFTRKHVTVALGGDGGDELFAGYDPFLAHYPSRIVEKIPRPLIEAMKKIVALMPVSTKNISLDFKIKQFLSAMHLPISRRHFGWLGSFLPEAQSRLFSPSVLSGIDPDRAFTVVDDYFKKARNGHELNAIIYQYCKLYLQDDILVKVDRASMANALETRAPFLDTEVVEFVCNVPNNLKLRGYKTKYLLKKTMEQRLGKEIVYRKKKGFGVPLADWFKGPLKPLISDLFSKEHIAAQGLFNFDYIDRMVNDHLAGKKDNRKPIWTLLVFQRWYETYL